MKGYLYIELYQVVWNPERKPKPLGPSDNYDSILDMLNHQEERKQWRENNVIVEKKSLINLGYYEYIHQDTNQITWVHDFNGSITPGTPATISKNTIIKIG